MNVTLTESGYTLDGKWRLVPVEPTHEMAILSLDGGLDYKLGVKAAPPPPAELAISGYPVAWRIDWPNRVTELGWYDDDYDPDNSDARGGEPISRPLYLHPEPPPPQQSPWQPIATAPKDKRVLLLRPTAPEWLMVMGGRHDSDGYAKNPKPYWNVDNWSLGKTVQRQHPPTHWMPLPEPAP